MIKKKKNSPFNSRTICFCLDNVELVAESGNKAIKTVDSISGGKRARSVLKRLSWTMRHIGGASASTSVRVSPKGLASGSGHGAAWRGGREDG